jgi:Tol biopolymer transport system component
MSLVQLAEPYTKFRSSTLLDWHPTASAALVVTATQLSASGQLQLAAGSGAPSELLVEPREHVAAAKFQPLHGNQVLVRTIAADGKSTLSLLDVSTRTLSRISAAGESAGMGAWSTSGDRVAFTTSAPRSKLYIGDPQRPDRMKVIAAAGHGKWRDVQFSPNGKAVVYVQEEAGADGVWIYDVETTMRKKITRGVQPTRYGAPQFSSNGSGIWLTAKRASTLRQLVYLDIVTGAETAVTTSSSADVVEFAISESAQRIAVNTAENETSVLRFFDLASYKELPRPALLPGEIVGIKWMPMCRTDQNPDAPANGSPLATSGGFLLGFSLASSRAPRDLFVYNAQTTKLVRWTNGAVAGLNAFQFAEPTKLSWRAGANDERSAELFLPDATRFPGRRPVLIVLSDEIAAAGNGGATPRGFIGAYQFLLAELGIAICYPVISGKGWDDVGARGLLARIGAHEMLNAANAIIQAAPATDPHVFAQMLAAKPGVAGGIFVGRKSTLPMPMGRDVPMFVVREMNEAPLEGAQWQILIGDTLQNADPEVQKFVFYAQLRFLQALVGEAGLPSQDAPRTRAPPL